MYEVVTGMLEKMHWMFLNQEASGTDGASSMTWHRTWLVARTRADVPTLINVHCSAHCGTLVAEDATRAFLQFQMLNCFANKAYEWVGHSTNQCNKLKPLLKGVFKEDYVVVLQIHVVRWFSQVMSWPAYYSQCRCYKWRATLVWEHVLIYILYWICL